LQFYGISRINEACKQANKQVYHGRAKGKSKRCGFAFDFLQKFIIVVAQVVLSPNFSPPSKIKMKVPFLVGAFLTGIPFFLRLEILEIVLHTRGRAAFFGYVVFGVWPLSVVRLFLDTGEIICTPTASLSCVFVRTPRKPILQEYRKDQDDGEYLVHGDTTFVARRRWQQQQ
jgi:hypothetical protein